MIVRHFSAATSLASAVLLLAGFGCSGGPSSTDSGPTVQCGAGTTNVNGVCQASSTDAGPMLQCGAGTTNVNGVCQPSSIDSGPTLQCGAGTVDVNGVCEPTGTDGGQSEQCGAGTVNVNGVCEPVSTDGGPVVQCGAGTVDVNGVCLPADAGSVDAGSADAGVSFAVIASGDGWETFAPDSPQIVALDGTQTFSVTATTGYTLSMNVGGTCPAGSWSDDSYTTGAITTDCDVTFAATLNSYQVTASGDGWETISPIGIQIVGYGEGAEFVVDPVAGYTVSATTSGSCVAGIWANDVYTTSAVTADCYVTFAATLNMYQVTAAGDGWETIAPTGIQTVGYDATQTFTVTAHMGYVLSTNVGGTCPSGSWSSGMYTTGAITGDCGVAFSANLVPAAPSGVTAVPSGANSIVVSWNPVANATGYKIYWSTTSALGANSGTQIAGVSSPYHHTGLTPGATYLYDVTTLMGSVEGPPSIPPAQATVTGPTDTTPPTVLNTSPPDNSVGAVAAAPIIAVFSKPMDPSTLTTASFTLFDGTMAIGGTVAYSGLTATFTPQAMLDFSTVYVATITWAAADTSELLMASDFVWTFTTQPAPPVGLSAIVGSNQDTLQWTPVVGASVYDVYSSAATGGPYTLAGESAGPSFSQSLTSPTYYVVTVQTADGVSPYSAEASATPDPTALSAPTGISAQGLDGQVVLAWSDLTPGPEYLVYRSTVTGGPYTALSTTPSPSDGYTDRTASNGTTYYYVIQNVGGTGGAYSAEVSATPTSAVPAAPAGLTAAFGSLWVHLNWTASAGAAEYVVYRGTTPGGPYFPIANPTAATYRDSGGLTNGTVYYYVVAVWAATGAGSFSNEATASPSPALAPETPVLTASAGNVEVELNWSACAGAAFYQVLRSTTSGGPYDVMGQGAPPAYIDVPGTDQDGNPTTVTNGTKYFYVVTANGQGSQPTETSNEVFATPFAANSPTATGVTVYAGAGQNSIVWQPTSPPGNYYVYRAFEPTGPFAGVCCSTTDPFFTDGVLANGTTYYYQIQNTELNWPTSVSATASATPESDLPLAPTNTLVAGGNTALSVTWQEVPGATSYNVYRESGSGWTLIGTSANDAYYDTELTNGTNYTYSVQAVNSAGSGSWSTEAAGTAGSNAAPPPASLQATAGAATVTLTWPIVPGLASYYSYYVLRSTTSGGPYTGISEYFAPDNNYFVDVNLANGTTYYYVVESQGGSAALWSANSPEVSATPHATLPAPPQSPILTGGNGALTLTWSSVPTATSYNIYRLGSSTWSLLGTSTNDSYNDTNLTNGGTYSYAVQAVNSAGPGSWSAEVTGTPSSESPPPPILTVFPGNASVTVIWPQVAGTASYYSYSLSRSTISGGPYTAVSNGFAPNNTDFVDINLANGTTYYYVVVANGPISSSAYSAEVSATPSASAPAAPTNLATAGGDSEITLTWTAVAGATAYNVYRESPAGVWAEAGTTIDVSYTDVGLINGNSYSYAVLAGNGSGNGSWSGTVSATPSAANPFAPTGVTVIPGNAMNTVVWNPVVGGYGYLVYAGTVSGGPYTDISGLGLSPLYSDSAAANGTMRCYVVVSELADGTTSEFSAESCATPSAALPPQPIGVSVSSPSAGQLAVTWSAVTGATSYLIYRQSGANGWIYSGEATATNFVDAGLVSGIAYNYAIAAVAPAGSSTWSAEAPGTP